MRMWTFVTQLLVTLVLLSFFLVSCQNVMHIFKGSLCFVLKHIHQELDKELGENEGLSDDEETISTRVVRRRVLFKVIARPEAKGRPGAGGGSAEARRSGGRAEGTVQGCVGASWGKAPASRSGDVLGEKGQEGLRGQALPWEQSPPQRGPTKLISGIQQTILILLLS